MNNDEENDNDGLPQSVNKALDLFLACVYDWEQFDGISEKDFGRLQLVRRIIEICDLPNNAKLRASCGSEYTSPKEAENVIIKRLWVYCVSKEV